MNRRREFILILLSIAGVALGGEARAALEPPPFVRPLADWCSEVKKSTQSMGWKTEPCDGVEWKTGGASTEGRPLVYAEFGDPQAANTTLILTMVHADEVTPLYLGLRLAHWSKKYQSSLKGVRVVIAPLVNPDGFYRKPRTRMNGRGVDVNRNFPTSDWESRALRTWKTKYKSDPRRFPGPTPSSEPETVFQENLIRTFRPQKILSIHSPLNHMDYDGPNNLTLAKFPVSYVQECLKLRKQLKAISSGFFPGSLGNYAGKELGIPTVTMELPSADHRRAERYWNQFQKGIWTMIEYKMPEPLKVQ